VIAVELGERFGTWPGDVRKKPLDEVLATLTVVNCKVQAETANNRRKPRG
jgi:hypothetical protein